MNDQGVAIRDRAVMLRVYELVSDTAGPSDDEYGLELALLDKMIKDFEIAEKYADPNEQEGLGRAAKDAAITLQKTIRGLAESRCSGPGVQIVDARHPSL